MKEKKVPMRRCVGCMESKPKQELVRIVCNQEGHLVKDQSGKANGRGVYLCLNKACMEKAKKRNAISRNLKKNISEDELTQIFKLLELKEEK